MLADRVVPRDLSERIHAAYQKACRASLVPHSCIMFAAREWTKAHPGCSMDEAEAAVSHVLAQAAGAEKPRELAGAN
jgi:hypothetical protein